MCSNVIKGINQDIPNSEEHPTQKPIKLMEHLIKIHSKVGDIILDPFAGCGSTLIAARKLGRSCIGFEIETDYFITAHKTLEFWKQQAKLEK